jgi:hypothetical protein
MSLERHTLHVGIRLVREPWERSEMRRTVEQGIGGAFRLLEFDDPEVDWTDDHVIVTATTGAVGSERDVLRLACAAVTAVREAFAAADGAEELAYLDSLVLRPTIGLAG